MIVTNTDSIEDRKVSAYLGIVSGEAILGANIFRDFFANIRDVVGGRSGSYEKVLLSCKDEAIQQMTERAQEMGADAILAVDLDYEVIGEKGSMLMVSANGTAVKLA